VGLQEHHDLPHDLLLGPGAGHPFLALGSDALQREQTVGFPLDDVKDLLTEGTDQLAGEVRANALDHPGAQVLLNAFERGGRDDPQVPALELKAVLAVVRPGAGAFDVFPRRDAGRRADDGHQLALAPDLDPQHAEAALGAVEGDALNGPLQVLGWSPLRSGRLKGHRRGSC
jgi:hypothetical protein